MSLGAAGEKAAAKALKHEGYRIVARNYRCAMGEIDLIAFTGSRAVGVGIFSKAAKVQPGQIWLKRTVLEMGGKNCIVVEETADVAAAADGTARVDYAWISDSIKTTLYDTIDTPLSKYFHDASNAQTDDVNMATHYGSLWYDITGFIPPTFSALLDGTDVSETMSRISIVKQTDYTTLLNTDSQPYFY
ncbi:MAG: YraN family protein, partial [Planctomycetes bacterium]|nr:YraN family protein [Planctomycetota bacterium]